MGEKWNRDATPAEKLLALFAILFFNDRAFSLTELTGKESLNSSKPSVARLIKQLERSGIGSLRKEIRDKEAFFRLDRPKRIPAVSLNAEGLSQLALCRDFLMDFLPEAMRREMQASLSQAACFLPEDASLPVGIGASFSKGHIDYTPFQVFIASLVEAIREQKVCSVCYRASLVGEDKKYYFAPKRLLAYHESMYAEGYLITDEDPVALRYDDPMKLAIHRMKSCTITERSAKDVPDVPLPDRNVFGMMPGEPFTAKIRFRPVVATYVAERQWSSDQRVETHDDGSITLHVQVSNVQECVAWILSFGESAEVLEPATLREEIAETVENLYEMYC
ncbi:MAG: WYL domain-containing transcriptional regulator [Desulfovibrio sp.]|nr:WYL domain-containing transcriptional regulator [Desulfovibrio sp.]